MSKDCKFSVAPSRDPNKVTRWNDPKTRTKDSRRLPPCDRTYSFESGPSVSARELTGDGPTVLEQCLPHGGLEGIVSKRMDAPYRSGPSKTWLKSKNPASEAVRREREEEWH